MIMMLFGALSAGNKTYFHKILVNENRISFYQNVSLGIDNQKQTKLWKLKMSLLFNNSYVSLGIDNQKQTKLWKLKMSLLFNNSLNTLRFFTHPVPQKLSVVLNSNFANKCVWHTFEAFFYV